MTSLPENVDASYLDLSEGDKAHQQHHDAIHAFTNSHNDDANTAAHAALFAATEPVHERLWIPATEFHPTLNAPSLGKVGGAGAMGYPAWLFDAATSEVCNATIPHIPGWATASYDLLWTNAGAGTGDVQLNPARLGPDADGEALTDEIIELASVTVPAPAQNVLKVTRIGTAFALPAAGEVMALSISRHATNAADTLPNDIGALGLYIVKAS